MELKQYKIKNSIFFSAYSEFPVLHPSLRKIILFHDVFPIKYPKQYGKYSFYFSYILKKSFNKNIKILTVSKYVKKQILDFAIKNNLEIVNKIEVIYNGYDEQIFRPLPNSYDKVENTFKLNQYFLYVGNTEKPRKNFSYLLGLWDNTDLKNRVPLVVVGKMKNDILKGRDYVKYLGYVSDEELALLYNNAIALIQPSYDEGFSLPPLEAMACGCPVVASNCEVHHEILEDAAMYFPDDKKGLYQILLNLLSNEAIRKSYGLKGLKRSKYFKWENSVKKLFKIIEEALYE